MNTSSPGYYQPRPEKNGTWSFETPTGTVFDQMTEKQARHFAELSERQDRERAATGSGIFAEILRKHFERIDPAPDSKVRDRGGRTPVVELQRRFSAASVQLNLAFQKYRMDRENPDFQRPYYRALERCQMLKTAIFRMMTDRRERRAA